MALLRVKCKQNSQVDKQYISLIRRPKYSTCLIFAQLWLVFGPRVVRARLQQAFYIILNGPPLWDEVNKHSAVATVLAAVLCDLTSTLPLRQHSPGYYGCT